MSSELLRQIRRGRRRVSIEARLSAWRALLAQLPPCADCETIATWVNGSAGWCDRHAPKDAVELPHAPIVRAAILHTERGRR